MYIHIYIHIGLYKFKLKTDNLIVYWSVHLEFGEVFCFSPLPGMIGSISFILMAPKVGWKDLKNDHVNTLNNF